MAHLVLQEICHMIMGMVPVDNMHMEVDHWVIGDFKFILELDTGLEAGTEYTLWVYWKQDGNEVLFSSRNFYFGEENQSHFRNFTKKVANDVEYRKQIVNFETDWQHISKIYVAAEHNLGDSYSRLPNFYGYIASDNIGKKAHEKLHDEFYSKCQNLYALIKNDINNLWPAWKVDNEKVVLSLVNQISQRQ